jgi:integrase
MSITAEKKHGRPTGAWRVEVAYKGQRLRGRATSIEAARDMEATFRARLANGEGASAPSAVDRSSPTTLLDALQKAQDRLWDEGAWKAQAIAHVRSLATRIGSTRHLSTLTSDDFEEAVEELLAEKSPGTVNRALSAVSKLLAHARRRGWMTQEIDLPWQRESEGRIRVLTAAEEERLFAAMPADIREFCILAIETGCRRGELLRITPEDRTRQNWLVLPKTKAGKPQGVPLTARAQAALDNVLALGVPSQQRVRFQFEAARIKAGLEDCCFHILRHTCATRLLERGVDLQLTQEWMRHRDLKTTLRYRHVSSRHLEALAATIGEAA